MNNPGVYILLFWLLGVLILFLLFNRKKINFNDFVKHSISFTTVVVAVGGFYFTVYSFDLNTKYSERSVQPAIVFSNSGGLKGKDRWSFRNVGQEPALKVVISYRMKDNEKWTQYRSVGFSGIAKDECFVLLNIEGPKSLIAQYEDIKGNLLTTIINENKNVLERISKGEAIFKTATNQLWQLNPVKLNNDKCIGIQI